MATTTAAVIGGGIGGLTAAIALQRAGVEVTVFERQAAFGEAGAGITLWPDAVAVLRHLGLGPTLDEHAVPVADAVICAPDGEPFPDLWLGSHVAERVDVPPLCIHRAQLHQALLDQASGARLVAGSGAVDVAPGDGDRPSTVRFADGTSASADLVVGADGVRSAVRAALFPEVVPTYAGQTVYRGVAPAGPAAQARAPFVAIGSGTRFGWEPLPHGQVYWFAGRFQPEGQPDDPTARREDLLAQFDGWAAPTAELIGATPSERILRNDVYVVGPIERWVEGTVALLGDAAHTVPPHVGHGACLAIEDAQALADIVAAAGGHDGSGGLPAALESYEADRAAAVAPLFRRAEELAAGLRVGQLPDPAPIN
jgi:2-polyprenyl-6-methoxyphenol hydroxylase-like FAD-dependent oxidoreductase